MTAPPCSFHGIFWSWGQEWVWTNMEIDNEGKWLVQALREGMAILVYDGSY